MKARYDFSAATKNPYAKRLKRSVTIRLDESTIEYFRDLAAELELPYNVRGSYRTSDGSAARASY